VTGEAATYHRIRSAISAARATGAVTVLASSTELSLPAAAEYAKNYMAMERVHGIGVTVGVGTLEIGPAAEPEPEPGVERRHGGDRRSGGERRQSPGKARRGL
jgi:hypothetical protein